MFSLKQYDGSLVLQVLWIQLHMTEVTIKHMKSRQLACILSKHVVCIYFSLLVFQNVMLPVMIGS